MSYSKPFVHSDRRVRILLIEDDERQINYAQQVLVGHELTVMRSWKELGNPSGLFRQFDLIITDLMLPKEQADGSVSAPDWKVGLDIYTKTLASLDLGEVRGVALVSNYEHHVDDARKSGWDHDEVKREIMHAPMSACIVGVGKHLEWDWEGKTVAAWVSSREDMPINYISVFDRSIWLMTEFLDQESQIRLAYPNDMPMGKPISQYLKEQGWIIPKPYREVVDALLMDLQ